MQNASAMSGTGKELIARAIHAVSPRAKGPFIAVNCAGLAPELLESTVFGQIRGSFTGADVRLSAATNRDLRQEVSERRFRDDLYYRLHVNASRR